MFSILCLSTNTTGKFEKGSFNEFPVSNLASNSEDFSFSLIVIWHIDALHGCFPKNRFINSIKKYDIKVDIIKIKGEILK